MGCIVIHRIHDFERGDDGDRVIAAVPLRVSRFELRALAKDRAVLGQTAPGGGAAGSLRRP